MPEARIAGLDGLRAVSVLVVFFHHTGLVPVHGGWVGVDVFFVISGYLITGSLIREHSRQGCINLRRFYARRMRRLVPALTAMVLAVGVYLWIARTKLDPALEMLPALLYVMNWVRAFEVYDAVLTGHTWSLAIEQQYYLLWPFVLVMLLQYGHVHRGAVAGVGALIVLAMAWRWAVADLRQIDGSNARIIYGFDTRADGLLVGGLIALLSGRVRAVIAFGWPLALAYLAWVVLSPFGNAIALSVEGYALTAWAAGVLAAKVVSDQASVLVRVLDMRLLASLGVVSYGFYLWHYPVVQILLYGDIRSVGAFFGGLASPSSWLLIAAFALSLLLTLLSWFMLEKPLLRTR